MKVDIFSRKVELIIVLSFILVASLTMATYILDQDKANWLCGPVLMLMELAVIGSQFIMLLVVWRSENRNLRRVILIVTLCLLGFIILSFINFNFSCS